MHRTFGGAKRLRARPLRVWDTSKVSARWRPARAARAPSSRARPSKRSATRLGHEPGDDVPLEDTFDHAEAFNRRSPGTSSVDMNRRSMRMRAAFNQQLDWDVASVTSFGLGGWDVRFLRPWRGRQRQPPACTATWAIVLGAERRTSQDGTPASGRGAGASPTPLAPPLAPRPGDRRCHQPPPATPVPYFRHGDREPGDDDARPTAPARSRPAGGSAALPGTRGDDMYGTWTTAGTAPQRHPSFVWDSSSVTTQVQRSGARTAASGWPTTSTSRIWDHDDRHGTFNDRAEPSTSRSLGTRAR